MVAVFENDVHIEEQGVAPQAQLAELETRLARGYEMIDDHISAGVPVSRLEEHWLTLLADYELLFESLS